MGLLAGVQGSGYCSTAISMIDSLWLSNTAQYGGALYADEGCSLTVHNTTFGNNYAQVPRPTLYLIRSVVAALGSHFCNHSMNSIYGPVFRRIELQDTCLESLL